LSQQVLILVSEYNSIFVTKCFINCINLLQCFLMLSLLLEALEHLCLCFTFKSNSFSNQRSRIGLSFGNSGSFISICSCYDLSCLCLSISDDFVLNKSGFSDDLTIFQFSISIDRVDHSISFSRIVCFGSINNSSDSINFLLFLHLLKLSLLHFILSLIFFDLLGSLLLFLIILDSLVISEPFSLQSGLELINGCLLHR